MAEERVERQIAATVAADIRRGSKCLEVYRSIGLSVFGAFLFVVVACVVLWGALELRHVITGRGAVVHSDSFDFASFKLTPPDAARATALEFDQYAVEQPYVFNPWTTFMLAPFKGRYLEVVESPVLNHRIHRQTTENGGDRLVVWAFGGSTLFGFGVPNQQTLPAHLERQLSARFRPKPVEVVNFGQPYWFSSSEFAIYAALLRTGRRPDVAIFLDGVNDVSWLSSGYEVPVFSQRAKTAWDHSRRQAKRDLPWFSVNQSFPPNRVVKWLNYEGALPSGGGADSFVAKSGNPLERILRNYRSNRAMITAISEQFGVTPYFFLQPAPWYGDYAEPLVRQEFPFGDKNVATRSYDALIEDAANPDSTRMYTLHDLLWSLERPFVDAVHYSDLANEALASAIAQIITVDD